MYNQFVRHPAGRKRKGGSRPLRLLTNHQVRFDSMDSSIIADTSAHLSCPKSYVPYNRSLSHGIGVNDFPSPTRGLKSYEIWLNMFKRCYAKDRSTRDRTYVGCSVSPEWHYFSEFERWFAVHYVQGFHLDKDILVPGNKVYGPNFCEFIPPELNSLLSDCRRARGELPLGVTADRARYKARVSVEHCPVYLGMFPTPQLAHKAWQKAKAYAISDFITNFQITKPRIRKALDLRVAQLRDDALHNRITVSL